MSSIDAPIPKNSSPNRRSFLKGAGALTVAALAVSEISPRLKKEVPPSARVRNGLQACTELVKAQISGETEKIIEARKLIVVWVFAECASTMANTAGFGFAGAMMEHYLYGKGGNFDITPMLTEAANRESNLWVGPVIDSFASFCENPEINPTLTHNTVEEFLQLFERYKLLLKEIGGRKVDRFSSDDLTYGTGFSTFIVHTDAEAAPSSSQIDGVPVVNILLQNSTLSFQDRYDWDYQNSEVRLGNYAKSFASLTTGRLIAWFSSNENLADEIMDKISFPQKYRYIVKDAITSLKQEFENQIDIIPDRMDNVVSWATGQQDGFISEHDLNLLKQLGAAEYDIRGSVFRKQSIMMSITIDLMRNNTKILQF